MSATPYKGAHYPAMPPVPDGEDSDTYTNRLLGAGGNDPPYNHPRSYQCAIGDHGECPQRNDGSTIGAVGNCRCPHHADPRLVAGLRHIVDYGEAVRVGLWEGAADAAVDVLIEAMADMDAPLRALILRWTKRRSDPLSVERCIAELTEVLAGRPVDSFRGMP